MTDPLFPPVSPRSPALPSVAGQVELLVGQCNGIIAKAEGATGRATVLDWQKLHNDLHQAIVNKARLPLSVRFNLEGIIAHAAADGEAPALVAALADHAVREGYASARMLAALLIWAPAAPRLSALWRQSADQWPPRRAGRWPVAHDWLFDKTPTDNLAAELAQHIRQGPLQADALPRPLNAHPSTPLAALCWDELFATAPDWWRARTADELQGWLNHEPPERHRWQLVDTVLRPHHGRTAGFRAALSDEALKAQLRVSIGGLGTLRGGRPDTGGLQPASAALVNIWRVLNDLEGWFQSWGGDEERLAFWRRHKQQVTDVEWFESSGWLGLQINGLWFAEHSSGKARVFILTKQVWETAAERIFAQAKNITRVTPDTDASTRGQVRAYVMTVHTRPRVEKAIRTGQLP